MLSIVICSKNPKISAELEKNIKNSVGLFYELIVIDNSKNEYSIFSAYNEGFRQSKFPNLCFIHEDVLFRTNNWGNLICEHLKNPNVGILGVAGGDLITKIPSSWSAHKAAANYIQFDKKTKKSKSVYYNKQGVENLHEVVLLDGFLLCMTAVFLQEVKFDEETFKGFHLYDVDICLQSRLAGFKNYVVFDVVIEHFSSGFKSKYWVNELFKLEEKWKKHLPMMSSPYSSEQIEKAQKKTFFRLVKRMIKVKMPLCEVLEKSSKMWQEIFPAKSNKYLFFWVYKTKFLLLFGIS